MQDLSPFFAGRHFSETIGDEPFQPTQWAAHISSSANPIFPVEEADIILIGCGETRGDSEDGTYSGAPDAVRRQLYRLYNWHPGVKVYDAGNILQGAGLGDTRAALRTVLYELQLAAKTVIVIGGSHDLTLQQYEAFRKTGQLITASVADMLIDLEESELTTSRSFLMDMLTGSPNFVEHYNHIGFQSYYVNPVMLETLDKLRFDCFRLGRVREHMEDMEPVLRNSHLFSFDMNAVKYCDAPMNRQGSPNGFGGDEACLLARYAGMSSKLNSMGIYGFDETRDKDQMTATLVAQMIWYFIDGFYLRQNEADFTDRNEFIEYQVQFTGNDIRFIKSKRSNRWWMELPDGRFEPCSYNDYLQASDNEIPERWLRVQERG